jgi:hypothetical protein
VRVALLRTDRLARQLALLPPQASANDDAPCLADLGDQELSSPSLANLASSPVGYLLIVLIITPS